MTTPMPSTTSNPHQPGKSWVVLDDGDGTINIILPRGFGKDILDTLFLKFKML